MYVDIRDLISGAGFVQYLRPLAHELSPFAAIIYGQLVASDKSFRDKSMMTVIDGRDCFFLTAEMLQEQTALNYHAQNKAIKELEAAGYVETFKHGIPAKKFFHVTDLMIDRLLKASIAKNEKLDAAGVTGSEMPENVDTASIANFERLGLQNVKGLDPKISNYIKKNNNKKNNRKRNDEEDDLYIARAREESQKKESFKNARIREFVSANLGFSEPDCDLLIDWLETDPDYQIFDLEAAFAAAAKMPLCESNPVLFFGRTYLNELKRLRAVAREQARRQAEAAARQQSAGSVPFYNWLEEREDEV